MLLGQLCGLLGCGSIFSSPGLFLLAWFALWCTDRLTIVEPGDFSVHSALLCTVQVIGDIQSRHPIVLTP